MSGDERCGWVDDFVRNLLDHDPKAEVLLMGPTSELLSIQSSSGRVWVLSRKDAAMMTQLEQEKFYLSVLKDTYERVFMNDR